MVLCLIPSNLRLRQRPRNSSYLPKQVDRDNYCKRHVTRPGCTLRPQILPSGKAGANGLHVFVVSDLHTDYSENMEWVRSLPGKRHKKDALLVAGDVAETFSNFVLTMSLLKDKFRHVVYVPGNHDLWCRREKHSYLDSLEKLDKLLDACQKLGVQTEPIIIDDLGVIPLFSWYHESFDREKDITGIRIPPLEMVIHFPSPSMQDLCPEKRMLFYPHLPKIIGSDFLESRIRYIHGVDGSASACHVFGHTHFCWDALLDGIRYVQAPLAYPRERRRRMNGGEDWLPFCIYLEGHFSERLSPCYWSDYYDRNPRTPEVTELAPWVARFYGRSS